MWGREGTRPRQHSCATDHAGRSRSWPGWCVACRHGRGRGRRGASRMPVPVADDRSGGEYYWQQLIQGTNRHKGHRGNLSARVHGPTERGTRTQTGHLGRGPPPYGSAYPETTGIRALRTRTAGAPTGLALAGTPGRLRTIRPTACLPIASLWDRRCHGSFKGSVTLAGCPLQGNRPIQDSLEALEAGHPSPRGIPRRPTERASLPLATNGRILSGAPHARSVHSVVDIEGLGAHDHCKPSI